MHAGLLTREQRLELERLRTKHPGAQMVVEARGLVVSLDGEELLVISTDVLGEPGAPEFTCDCGAPLDPTAPVSMCRGCLESCDTLPPPAV